MNANKSSVTTALEILRSIGNLAGRAVVAVFTDSPQRAAIRQLSSLDDRLLKDIGIGRSEISAAVMGIHQRGASSPAARPTMRGHQDSPNYAANENRTAQAA